MLAAATVGGLLGMGLQRHRHGKERQEWEAESHRLRRLALGQDPRTLSPAAHTLPELQPQDLQPGGARPSAARSLQAANNALAARILRLEGEVRESRRRADGLQARHSQTLGVLRRRLGLALEALDAGKISASELQRLVEGLADADCPLTAEAADGAPARGSVVLKEGWQQKLLLGVDAAEEAAAVFAGLGVQPHPVPGLSEGQEVAGDGKTPKMPVCRTPERARKALRDHKDYENGMRRVLFEEPREAAKALDDKPHAAPPPKEEVAAKALKPPPAEGKENAGQLARMSSKVGGLLGGRGAAAAKPKKEKPAKKKKVGIKVPAAMDEFVMTSSPHGGSLVLSRK